MGVIKIIGTPLYQWELGRKISISTSEHTIINKVEFSHDGDTESLVVKPRVENDQMVADIPNIMLLSGHYIHVYISYSDENLLETVAYDILPVMKRPKPSDYVYTETEVESYAELEARVAELEKVGGLDPETIKEAIDEYLTENPLDSKPIKGVDYFTPEEVQEIAEQAAQLVEVPDSGDYELPIANPETLGGVKPVAKGADMTQEVGVDELGGLWTAPSVSGGCGTWEHICDITTTEEISSVEVTQNADGVLLSDLKYNELWVLAKMVGVSTNTGNWWKAVAKTDTGRLVHGAQSSNLKTQVFAPFYIFIRGSKTYHTDSSAAAPYSIRGGEDMWISHFLDYYNSDHFVSLTIQGTTLNGDKIGIDTEIRVLGRRA